MCLARNSKLMSLKRAIHGLVNHLGYDIIRKRSIPSSPLIPDSLSADMKQGMQLVQNHTMLPPQRLVSLFQQALFCEISRMTGAFVECGTWKGGAVGLMAFVNLRHGKGLRHIHLFDSFEGIPEPDKDLDGERAHQEVSDVGGESEGRLQAVDGFYEAYADGVGTLDDNKNLLQKIIGYDASHLHYHKGWFQDTIPNDAKLVEDIAILRLDGDWYASTKICLDYLYDQVVPGGFIIVDDYGYYEGCRNAVDEFLDGRGIHVYMQAIDNTAVFWIKP